MLASRVSKFLGVRNIRPPAGTSSPPASRAYLAADIVVPFVALGRLRRFQMPHSSKVKTVKLSNQLIARSAAARCGSLASCFVSFFSFFYPDANHFLVFVYANRLFLLGTRLNFSPHAERKTEKRGNAAAISETRVLHQLIYPGLEHVFPLFLSNSNETLSEGNQKAFGKNSTQFIRQKKKKRLVMRQFEYNGK